MRVAVRVGGQDRADLAGDLRFEILLASGRHLDQAPDGPAAKARQAVGQYLLRFLQATSGQA